MSAYDVAFIGTGNNDDLHDPGPTGFAMNYYHAEGYENLSNCSLVACADLDSENAATFAETFDIDHTFEDYEEMVDDVEPDVVSISVWPDIHAEVVVDCANADSVEAIHCEKPMDLTWEGSQRMSQVCWRQDVQLTFNHMRRFKPTWVEARDLIRSGEIGELQQFQLSPGNIYDGGTHMIDFATGVAGDCPASWVIGQIDYREENRWFGSHNENQAYALWEYENGIEGIVSTGQGASIIPANMRFIGSDGILDVAPDDGESGNEIRWRQTGQTDWDRRTVEEGSWTDPINDAVEHVIDCLEDGQEPVIGARNALNPTEIIFGIWESSRRHGRVEFPLEFDGNPLHDMVASGDVDPQ